jgi:hypothetical protein
MKIVSLSLEQGNKYFGKIDGTRFFINNPPKGSNTFPLTAVIMLW